MIREIQTIEQPVFAEIRVPGSKSITNRALVCAALADGVSTIRNASDSNDTALMINGLNQLGILVRKSGSDLIVEGKGGRIFAPKFPIPVGNAGTTLRFLIGVAALADGTVLFQGNGRMTERPIRVLLDALRDLGVETEGLDFAGRWAVKGGSFRGGVLTIRSDVSSQFISSLLLVAPYAEQDVSMMMEGEPVSAPYVGMTEQVMKAFGASIERRAEGGGAASEERRATSMIAIKAGIHYSAATVEVEPDISLASVFFAMAAITGGEVSLAGMMAESIQGDVRILEILGEMGCQVVAIPEDEGETRTLKVTAGKTIRGGEFNLRSTPDLVPPVAAIALFAEGPTTITNVPQLRYKESDRLEVLSGELKKTGAKISLNGDGLEIEPGSLHGAELDPHEDHRLAMCFAIIGLKVPGISVKNPECVGKSFPGFWAELARMVAGKDQCIARQERRA